MLPKLPSMKAAKKPPVKAAEPPVKPSVKAKAKVARKDPLPPLPAASSTVKRVDVRPEPKPRRFVDKDRADILKQEARLTQEALVKSREAVDQKIDENRGLLDRMALLQEEKSQGLTTDEKVLIIEAHFSRNIGPKAIAEALGRPHSTISRFLKRYKSTAPMAKHLINAGAEVLAERVIEQASVADALEVLDRIDVLPRKQRGGDTQGPRFNIFVGGGSSAHIPPVPDQKTIDTAAVRVSDARPIVPELPEP